MQMPRPTRKIASQNMLSRSGVALARNTIVLLGESLSVVYAPKSVAWCNAVVAFRAHAVAIRASPGR